MMRLGTLDIEIYNTHNDTWAQGKYLVHGFDDVLWTDDLDAAVQYLKLSIIQLEKASK
jgi:hypothetical protein